jgi:hypothetical protein
MQQTDMGDMRRCLADQRGGFMISVRIVAPGHENGAAVECREPSGEMTRDPLESGPSSRRLCIPYPEKDQALGRHAEMSDRCHDLLLADRCEAFWRICARTWMRAATVGQDSHNRRTSIRAARRDQTATAKAFIIGVRREHEACCASRHFFQRSYRQRAPLLVQILYLQGGPSGIG